MRETIEVIQADIDAAEAWRARFNATAAGLQPLGIATACNCPIAQAIRRCYAPRGQAVQVHACVAVCYTEPRPIECELPPAAREFITAWDTGLPCFPFSFTVVWH